MDILDIIDKKEKGEKLTKEELQYTIDGYLNGTIKDYQMSAFLTEIDLLGLTEEETINMSCAIIDAFKIKGSKLYVDKYAEPGMQEAATPTYPVNYDVLQLINGNPNMVEEARNALWNRYNATDSSGVQTQAEQRNNVIDATINEDPEQSQSNYESNMEESITNSITTRQEYLEGLSAAAAATTTTTTN